MKKTIFYATTNAGKFEEIKRYLDAHEPTIELKQLDQDLPELQTMDQKAIALDKARQAWEIVKQPVLVDDAGVYFDHYNNFPGTLTKFVYHGIGFEGILKLTEDDNRASMRLFMVYKDNENEDHLFEGVCEGTFIRPESFDAHPALPYDAVFKPNGSDVTMAKLRGTEKEKEFAYRLRALKKFLDWFRKT